MSYFLGVPFDEQVEGCFYNSNVLGVSSETAEPSVKGLYYQLAFLPMET